MPPFALISKRLVDTPTTATHIGLNIYFGLRAFAACLGLDVAHRRCTLAYLNPEEFNADVLAAWSTDVEADGFVDPSDYRDPDIVCHVNASNARGYATVAAGDAITFQWRGWPLNHHGPVLSYMAHCDSDSDSKGGACATVDKSQLEFFEVQRAGLLDPDILSDPSSAASLVASMTRIRSGSSS